MKSFQKTKKEKIEYYNKFKINNKKKEHFINIDSIIPHKLSEQNKKNYKVENIEKEVFLDLNLNSGENSIKKDIYIEPDIINLLSEHEDIAYEEGENCDYMLGKKRNNLNLRNISPKNTLSKYRNNLKKIKKSNVYKTKYNQKNHGNTKTPENFIQIINLFPVSEGSSNKKHYTEKTNDDNNKNKLDMGLNNTWINWINEILSKNNENNGNENNKKEESTPPVTFKIKDLFNYTFSNSYQSNSSNEKSKSKKIENEKFIDVSYKKEDNYLPNTGNDLIINCSSTIKDDSKFPVNEENEKYSVIVEDKIKHIKVEEISD